MTLPDIFIEHPDRLITHIIQRLHIDCLRHKLRDSYADTSFPSSAVLFPLGQCRVHGRSYREPCLILNERSQLVRQPGDLCFPGGGIMQRADRIFAGVLGIPGFPLARWTRWPYWRSRYPETARRMALILATGLRESFEEMRLNPFSIRFLGPMPSEHLVLFHQVIFPAVGWVNRPQRFKPNWEVAQIIYLPLRDFFDPGNYACIRYHYRKKLSKERGKYEDYLCFVPPVDKGTAPLWGVTFRIILTFLEVVFGFQPPDIAALPMITAKMQKNYMTGPKRQSPVQ